MSKSENTVRVQLDENIVMLFPILLRVLQTNVHMTKRTRIYIFVFLHFYNLQLPFNPGVGLYKGYGTVYYILSNDSDLTLDILMLLLFVKRPAVLL